jgi:transcriptional regulator with XRE-family HTH domain
MHPSPITEHPSFIDRIKARQAEIGLTDQALSDALDFQKLAVIEQIKAGNMRMPIAKVPALSKALNIDARDLLHALLRESAPDLLSVLEEVLNPLALTSTEVNLINHVRSLAGDRTSTPVVFEGRGVIALIAV